MKGHCSCGAVEIEMRAKPMITHCCHCTWCQRESGSAFVLNAYVETANVVVTKGEVECVEMPTLSGKGQKVNRCPSCKVALWSHYAGSGMRFAFVRVGALDNPGHYPPDVHIFASTKLPWVTLLAQDQVFDGFYDPKEVWDDEALDRFVAAKLEVTAAQ